MSVQTPRRDLAREDVGGVTVLRLTVPKLLDEREIRSLFGWIVRLLDEEGRRYLVLNFCRAEPLASTVIGQLLMLNRRVQARDGRLVLCGFGPRTPEILSAMRLAPLFRIRVEEEQALRSLDEEAGSGCVGKGADRESR
ncbi:MAG TPA: STAS domain-containing protein [Gemmataceae bacterium]|jgi:anti-anti-sigma regulatory factor